MSRTIVTKATKVRRGKDTIEFELSRQGMGISVHREGEDAIYILIPKVAVDVLREMLGEDVPASPMSLVDGIELPPAPPPERHEATEQTEEGLDKFGDKIVGGMG